MPTDTEPDALAQGIDLRACVGPDHKPYVAVFASYADGERLIAQLPAGNAAFLATMATDAARIATNNAAFAEWLRVKLDWDDTPIVQAMIELKAIADGHSNAVAGRVDAAAVALRAQSNGLLDRLVRWAIKRQLKS